MIESIAEEKQQERAPLAERTRGLRRRMGARMAALRRERGWSQEELADLLSVPRSRLGKWENGYTAPPPEDLVALGEILGITVDELLTGERPPRVLSPEAHRQLAAKLTAIIDLLK
jgi:transcriptional regulator with XRE-family HTH domain